MTISDFLTRLGSVFVPATVLMQIDAGLDAYIPSVPAGLPGKPAGTPDETAILFWDSQQNYTDGFGKLAVRAYTLTHGAVYGPSSGAAFPIPFTGAMAKDQPYFLVDQPADWMHGRVTHFLGARPDTMTPESFRAELSALLSELVTQSRPDGGIACAGDDYLALWTLAADSTPPTGEIANLATVCTWHHSTDATPTQIDAGLWDEWAGLSIASGDTLNMQFARRGEQA
jgi:hypothetical protein